MSEQRAAIYARVSTDEQADKKTIDDQVRACRLKGALQWRRRRALAHSRKVKK